MPCSQGQNSYMPNPLPTLALLETRVLGTLVEKQHTVPDAYPLTLNALVSGCNQKTSRAPVMEATETEVQGALDSLKSANFVMETSGGRVSRYSHNLERVLQVPAQSGAILTPLMLRGPQTGGGVPPARLPGARENRWAHLLSGRPEVEPISNFRKSETPTAGADQIAALKA